ncbi:MAG: ComF family protein [Bacteroidales bacterium]|nr:ComF family protein [Bacteroidales bacterium]
MTFRDWLHSILNLFYPRVCAACGESLLKDEETVCLKCRYLLPKTGYELNPDNPLAQTFYGRVKFHAVTACFFFAKSGKVQHLIHELKYKGNKEAGVFLGQQLGETIKDAPLFQGIDYLIPVPLHPKREKQRGYNQSLMIAKGINEVTGIPIGDKYLIRAVNTATQTKKSAEERYKNVKDIFEVRFPEELEGKHVLLIDDVLTTGATLESCAHQLENISGIVVSAATAACAGN